jgi:hypothetical protein
MGSFLINKNLPIYYLLRKRIGKERAYRVASVLEKVILISGREDIGGRENGGVRILLARSNKRLSVNRGPARKKKEP